MKDPINRLRIRLGLDIVCWTALTVWLAMNDYPTAGALIGATGFVYLNAMRKRYNEIKMAIDLLKSLP